MESPLISIIIPVYNVEKFIEHCAISLFEQTLNSIQYIFINDCTNDKSIDILQRVIENYPERRRWVKIIENDQNLGQAGSRKKGILEAKGEYIIHCDPDDWVDTSMYEKLYNKAKESDADIVWCNYVRVFSDGILQKCNLSNDNTSFDVLKSIFRMKRLSPLWNVIVKREIAQSDCIKWPTWNNSEDMALISQYVCMSNKIAHINDHLYFYRMVESSITHDESKALERIIGIAKSTQVQFECLRKYGFDDLIPDLYAYQFQIKTRSFSLIKNTLNAQKQWLNILPERNLFNLWSSTLPMKYKMCLSLIFGRLLPVVNVFYGLHERLSNFKKVR